MEVEEAGRKQKLARSAFTVSPNQDEGSKETSMTKHEREGIRDLALTIYKDGVIFY